MTRCGCGEREALFIAVAVQTGTVTMEISAELPQDSGDISTTQPSSTTPGHVSRGSSPYRRDTWSSI